MTGPEISILIPAFNEAESIGPLVEKIAEVVSGLDRSAEILVIDDGSSDGTDAEVEARIGRVPGLRLIRLRANCGKAAALSLGFAECRGREAVVTMDADLQDDPEEIGPMLAMLEEGYDLVSGWKRRRHDPWTKTVPSWFFNRATSLVSGIRLHDFNCGFKAYRRSVVDSLEVRGELHRFLPVLAHQAGWKVGEREVRHHPRRHGRSKFGTDRFVNGFLDLLLVVFYSGRYRSPLHVFGRLGVAFLAVGLALNAYMAVIWVVEERLRVRPLLLFGVILVIIGIQFISMGLLAEMIAGVQPKRDLPVQKRRPEEDAS